MPQFNDCERDRIAEQAAPTRLPVAILFHAASLSAFPEFRKRGNVRSMSADKAIRLRSTIFIDLPKPGIDSGGKLFFHFKRRSLGLQNVSSRLKIAAWSVILNTN